ncbi:MAG: DUF1566 domain-containing protein, partial [Candidatus Hermodarchaeota archaeon]
LKNSLGKAKCLNNIALVYRMQGNNRKALKKCEEALQIVTQLGLSKSQLVKVIKTNIEILLEGARFIDSGDGTVIDALTNLQWQKETDEIKRTYEEAESYAKLFCLAGHTDWRLPRKEELMKLAEIGYTALKLVFPNIKADLYWARTDRSELYWTDYAHKIAYTVEFDPSKNLGEAITYYRSYKYNVWMVRDK